MAKLHHPQAGLLIVRNKKQTMVPLTKDVTTIGRKQADIILDDPKISSTHTEIARKGDVFVLRDLKSTNGTFVNRRQVEEAELVDQDIIELGSSTLCFYEDHRNFHGKTQSEALPHSRPKNEGETVSLSTKTKEMVTNSRTLRQSTLRIVITDGPDKGKKFSLSKSHIILGRRDADITLQDVDVSRAHALIEVLGPQTHYLRDLNSTNGTLVNGKKTQTHKLQSGDEVTIGNTTLKIDIEGSPD